MTDIIVEDGSIVSGANSYITVSGVGVYATDYGYSDWTNSSATIKQQALFKGMRYIEGLSFKGIRQTEDQELAFPRSDLYDNDNYLIDDDVVPSKVVKALCEASILSLPDSDITLQPAVDRDDYRKKLNIAGVIIEEWDTDRGLMKNKSIAINDILKGLVKSSFIVEVERG